MVSTKKSSLVNVKHKYDLDVFIPVYNEAKILKNNVAKVYQTLLKNNIKFDIYIVDDGSKDNTSEVVKTIKNKSIHYIRYEKGASRRENLFKSMNEIGKRKIVCFLDVARINPSYLVEFLPQFDKYDVIIGSRYLNNLFVKRKLFRSITSFLFNGFWILILNSKIKDGNCGIKLFKRTVFNELYNWLGYDFTLKRGWLADRMILKKAEKENYNVAEFQIEWIDRNESSFKFKQELQMIMYFFKNFGLFMRLR